MYPKRVVTALLICIATPAWAQSLPLNLKMPRLSQQASAVGAPASAPVAPTAAVPDPASMPSPYNTTYGDRRDAAENGCVDEAYSKPQVQGSVAMGVAASNHGSGSYESTELDVNKPLGSCDDPKGDVSASIRVTKSNFNFGRRNLP